MRRWMVMGLLFGLASCSSYRVLHIDVLKPAGLDLEDGEKVVFVDRNLVHRKDSAAADFLRKELGLTRNDLVDFFYDGLKDGLQWGVKNITLEKTYGIPMQVVEDGHIAPPYNKDMLDSLAGKREAAYLVDIVYCKYHPANARQVVLDNNMLIRLYDVKGGVIMDTLISDKLVSKVLIHPSDYTSGIRDYFYNKGWSYAEHLSPVWIPADRRIYNDHRLLKMGYYFFETGDFDQAAKLWSAAMDSTNPHVAAKAAVNMSWLYERNGNFETATEILETAQTTLENKKVKGDLKRYIHDQVKVLQKRSEDDIKLMDQL